VVFSWASECSKPTSGAQCFRSNALEAPACVLVWVKDTRAAATVKSLEVLSVSERSSGISVAKILHSSTLTTVQNKIRDWSDRRLAILGHLNPPPLIHRGMGQGKR